MSEIKMFFATIGIALADANASVVVRRADDDKLEVELRPAVSSAVQPLLVRGTAEDLDREFPDAVLQKLHAAQTRTVDVDAIKSATKAAKKAEPKSEPATSKSKAGKSTPKKAAVAKKAVTKKPVKAKPVVQKAPKAEKKKPVPAPKPEPPNLFNL